MTSFRWLDSMSVGVVDFDNDHKNYFAALNAIEQALRDGTRDEALLLCRAFLELAIAHGRREEEFLRQANYPRMDKIMDSQVEAQATINGLLELIRSAPDDALRRVVEMRHMVVTYLLDGDINYKSFVEAKPASTRPDRSAR